MSAALYARVRSATKKSGDGEHTFKGEKCVSSSMKVTGPDKTGRWFVVSTDGKRIKAFDTNADAWAWLDSQSAIAIVDPPCMLKAAPVDRSLGKKDVHTLPVRFRGQRQKTKSRLHLRNIFCWCPIIAILELYICKNTERGGRNAPVHFLDCLGCALKYRHLPSFSGRAKDILWRKIIGRGPQDAQFKLVPEQRSGDRRAHASHSML